MVRDVGLGQFSPSAWSARLRMEYPAHVYACNPAFLMELRSPARQAPFPPMRPAAPAPPSACPATGDYGSYNPSKRNRRKDLLRH